MYITLFIFGIWSPQGTSFARKQTRNLEFVRDIRNVICHYTWKRGYGIL